VILARAAQQANVIVRYQKMAVWWSQINTPGQNALAVFRKRRLVAGEAIQDAIEHTMTIRW
jgi:hypothetical protein